MLVVDEGVSDVAARKAFRQKFRKESRPAVPFPEDDNVGNGCSRTQDVDPDSRKRRRFVSQQFLPGVGAFLRRANKDHLIIDGFRG